MALTQKQIVSVAIPVFNEELCIEELVQRITRVVSSSGLDYEIVFIDDSSQDKTYELIRSLHEKDSRVKVVRFSRNFGHQIAVAASLQYVQGDCAVIMDGDLQDPPELIAGMVAKWQEGAHVVYAVRRHRDEPWFKRLCYKMFYSLLHMISPLRIPQESGDFCLMDRRVVQELKKLHEDRPFMRGLRAWVGFKQVGIEYDRPARKTGETKYSMMKLFGLALDGLLSFSNLALRISTMVGFVLSLFSIGYASYIAINRILIMIGAIESSRLIPGWASLVCGFMFLMGLQCIFLGVIGDYVGRIFMQVKQRPLFIVDEEIGFGAKSSAR